MASVRVFDCQQCGACCCNPDINRRRGLVNYVEVEKTDRIRKKPELMRRLVVLDDDGIPHMRMDEEQRCAALEGTVGEKVGCSIYPYRPSGCRLVEPGDEECRRARRQRGVDPPRVETPKRATPKRATKKSVSSSR
jgi:Fe-S-cluster containining protein